MAGLSLIDWFHKLQFTKKTRADVWQLVGDLTRAGMSETDALEAIIAIYSARKDPSIVYILKRIRNSIGTNTFNFEVNRYSSASESIMFSSHGTADASRMYTGAARILKTQILMRKTVTAALFQPLIALATVFMLYYILGDRMFPQFMLILPIEHWSPISRTVARVALFLASNTLLVLGFIAFLIGLLGWMVRNYSGPGRVLLDQFPPFSLYRISTGVAFLMTIIERGRMGSSLNTQMLQAMARHSSGYMKSRILAIARYSDQDSGGIGSAARQAGQNFPSLDLALIMAKYSETGGDWLVSFSRFMDGWIEDVQTRIRTMAVALNTIPLFFVTFSIALGILTIFTIVTDLQKIQ
ncbi:MAG: hypothetical protein OXH65_02855 [Paracoccaceae bacterium]|nr:hypothetical protein [Paracoccaceae bacterium]